MGENNSPNIFQQKMNNLFQGFEFISSYMDDLLILTKGYWTDDVHKLALTLNKLKEIGLKFNIEKNGKTKIEYLGFWVTHDSVKSIYKNRSNKNMTQQTYQKQLRLIIGLVYCHRNMWARHSHTL